MKYTYIRAPCESHAISDGLLLHLVSCDVLFCVTVCL